MTVPLPPVTRVRCHLCRRMVPATAARKVRLAPRLDAWRCRECAP